MTMPRSSPSAQGVDSRGLLALLDAVEVPGHGYHSLMVARHGHVIAEGWWAPYARERVHLAYSLSKSFTATVLGHLVGKGLIDLDAPVLSYITHPWPVSPVWDSVTVRHCITMTAGHTVDAWDERFLAVRLTGGLDDPDPVLETILAREPDGEPGQVWAYNQVATYLVAQAIAGASGEPLSAHVRRVLLDPFGADAARAQRTPQGRDVGFSGLHVTTPSILALAQTWLDKGRWQGAEIAPAAYAELAPRPTPASLTVPQEGDWAFGYGCSFWGASHGYRGDGAYGQFAVVLPDQDVAVAITSEVEVMQDVLDLLWTHLLPAIDAQPDAEADERLARRLSDLRHPALSGHWLRAQVSAERDPASQFPAELSRVVIDSTEAGRHVLRIVHPSGELVSLVGDGEWLESNWPTPFGPELALASSGGWDDGVFTAQLRLVETPHTILVRADAAQGTVLLSWRMMPLTGPDPFTVVSFSF